jgi:hypothetical protein
MTHSPLRDRGDADTWIYTISEGTSEIQRLVIPRTVFGAPIRQVRRVLPARPTMLATAMRAEI